MFLYSKNNTTNKSRPSHNARQISLNEHGFFSLRESGVSTIYQDSDFFVYHRGFPTMSPESIKSKIIKNISPNRLIPEDISSLNGSYLFFVLSLKTGEISIFRDGWGSTPVFYAKDGSAVSDTIATLGTALPNLHPDKKEFAEYLSCSYVVGENTLYQEIKALTPLNALHIKAGSTLQKQVHRYPSVDPSITQDALVPLLEKAIDSSVNAICDVLKDPEKIFLSLSGGTDSSLLAAKLSSKIPGFLAGTVDYVDWTRNDTPYFNHVVKALGLASHVESIDNIKYAQSLVELFKNTRTAYHTFAPSFHSLVSNAAKNKPSLAYQLNGTGPDEAVIGFELYSVAEMREFDKLEKSKWVDFLLNRLDSFYTPYWTIERILNPGSYAEPARSRRVLAESLLEAAPLFSEFQRRYSKETTTDHHIRMLYDVSDQYGMDMLFPYCTQELFELCFKASYYSINDDFSYKNVFKKVLLKYFDKDFVYRPKIGFHAPIDRGFKDKNGMGGLLARIRISDFSDTFDARKLGEEIDYRLHNRKAPLDYLLWTSLNVLMFLEANKK